MPTYVSVYLPKEEEWIIGVVDGSFLKMVRLHVTGSTKFDWISTKFDIDYNETCLTSFTVNCYAGKSAKKSSYLVNLVAEPEGE